METLNISLTPELHREQKIARLLEILDEGDRQIEQGKYSPYSMEDLLRDVEVVR